VGRIVDAGTRLKGSACGRHFGLTAHRDEGGAVEAQALGGARNQRQPNSGADERERGVSLGDELPEVRFDPRVCERRDQQIVEVTRARWPVHDERTPVEIGRREQAGCGGGMRGRHGGEHRLGHDAHRCDIAAAHGRPNQAEVNRAVVQGIDLRIGDHLAEHDLDLG
jgi:hypothetical protein